ncbi:hypothetical protein CCACVL1_06783, partial [Corchorus capsularis]
MASVIHMPLNLSWLNLKQRKNKEKKIAAYLKFKFPL